MFKPESIHFVNRTVSYTDPDTGIFVNENLDSCKMVLLPKNMFLQKITFGGVTFIPFKIWWNNYQQSVIHGNDELVDKDNLEGYMKRCFEKEERRVPNDIVPFMLKFHIDYNHLLVNGNAASAVDYVNPY